MAFVGLPSRGSGDDYEAFLDKQHWVAGFPHAVDDDEVVWDHYGVTSTPSLVLIAADGTTETVVGRATPEMLTRKIPPLTG